MTNTKSAGKKVRVNLRNYKINRFYKTLIKKYIKRYKFYLNSVNTNEKNSIQYYVNLQYTKFYLSLIYSKIDKATKKKVFHKNQAARKKSRLTKLVN